jgi:formylglycine-generating enzyme required for sulfatase activity
MKIANCRSSNTPSACGGVVYFPGVFPSLVHLKHLLIGNNPLLRKCPLFPYHLNVSWHDATAFCAWLTARLGYEIRLPTEWEWQQAATGGDPANQYPWGPEWDSDRANTAESGLSSTTAVGIYPHGASPVGALDMSGNVWEWCLNEYVNPRRVDVSGWASRAVRGGSFNYRQDFARSAYRFHFYPDLRYDCMGFRVVCSSPIF